MRNRKLAALLGATAAIATIASCSSGDSQMSDTFTLGMPADRENIDPHGPSATSAMNVQLRQFLYDPLVNLTTEGEIVSGIADTWTVEGGSVTFSLRDDVVCGDGTVIDVSAVLENLEYVLDPDNASLARDFFIPADAEVSADGTSGTVTVESSTPSEYLLVQLSGLGIVCPDGLAEREILVRGSDGTGPYVVDSASPGNEYRLSLRDDYAWGPNGASSDGLPASVVVRLVENESTLANLLMSGEISAAKILGSDRARVEGAGLTSYTFRRPVGQIWFNQRDGHLPADDVLRQALVQAADMSEASAVATQEVGVPSNGMLAEPMICGGVDPAHSLPNFDPQAAEAGLELAGWTRDRDGWTRDGDELSLKFIYSTALGTQIQSAIELLRVHWQEVGIKVEIQPVPPAEIGRVLLETGDWDIFWGLVHVQVPTQVMPFIAGAELPNGLNYAGIESDYSPGASGRGDCEAWNAAEAELYTSSSVVPLDDEEIPFFARGATFDVLGLVGGQIIPTSIRME
jgi:peptide/nickel transport system substrate-binding protein